MNLTDKRLLAEAANKTGFEMAYADKRGLIKAGTVEAGIWSSMDRIKTKKNDRALLFTLQYYGLLGELGKTLEEIGENASPQLTRERVRQLIAAVVNEMQHLEASEDDDVSLTYKPFKRVRLWFGKKLAKNAASNVSMLELQKESMMVGFAANNVRGISSFLGGANIKTLTVKNCIYLYKEKVGRHIAESDIFFNKKEEKRKATESRRAKLSKTVTYVPPGVRKDVLALCEKNKVHLNRFYEMAIDGFIDSKPWKGHKEYFEKTQSWRARNGDSDWLQVGLLIKNNSFEKAKHRAGKLDISLMAFIARAIAWSTDGSVPYEALAASVDQ